MAYLEKEDYTISSSIEDLDKIMTAAAQSSGKTQDVIRQESEDTAEATIRSYTEARYDMDSEFVKDAPDATRARMVIKCMVDISLYFLHHTINPRNIPKLREKAYMDCIDTLKGIRSGSMTLVGVPELTDPLTFTVINSQPKFISKPFQDLSING